MARAWILGMCALFSVHAHCDLDLGDKVMTSFGHGQQVCEISRFNLAVRSYGLDMDFWYVCTVTLTLVIWPWVKVKPHPWVMDNNCMKYYPDPTWQWRVMARIRIFNVCTVTLTLVKVMTHHWVMDNKCVKYYSDRTSWSEVMARTRCEKTDRQTERQTDGQGASYIPPNFVCGGYKNPQNEDYSILQYIYGCNLIAIVTAFHAIFNINKQIWRNMAPARKQIYPRSKSKVNVTAWYQYKWFVKSIMHAKYRCSNINTSEDTSRIKVFVTEGRKDRQTDRRKNEF